MIRDLRVRLACLLVAAVLVTGATPAMAQPPGEPRITELAPVAGEMALARAVTSGPDGLVAIGTRSCRSTAQGLPCFGEVWTSADGDAWEPVAPRASGISLGDFDRCGTSGAQPGLIDVAYGPAGYLAIGNAATRRQCPVVRLWRSADGRSWERVELTDGFPRGFQPSTLSATSDGYVVGGVIQRAPALPRASLLTSPDGGSWTRARPARVFDIGGYLDTGEAPASGGIKAVVSTPSGLVAVGDACPDVFAGIYLNRGGSYPPSCFGQSWMGADVQGWTRLDTPGVRDLVDAEAMGDRIVAAASICLDCPPVMLVAEGGQGDEAERRSTWTFAYGSPVGGSLLDLTASGEHFWAVLATPDGAALDLWGSQDGTRWIRNDPRIDLPTAMEFDDRAGVEAVALSDRLIIVAGGATVPGEEFRSYAIVVPFESAPAG